MNDPSKLARTSTSEGSPIGLKRARFDAPSKLACVSPWWSGSHAGPTAPLDEHRPL